MRNSRIFFHRMVISVLLLMGLPLAIIGCGDTFEKNQSESNVTTISFTKEGGIRSSTEEGFEQSYYDKDDLQQSILELAADYNKSAGGSRIAVEKVEADNGRILVQMTYERTEDYAAFNHTDFFAGSPSEAEAAGYQLNVVLSGVKDPQDTIGKADILSMKDETLLITDAGDETATNGENDYTNSREIELNGRAVYVSDNVTVSDNGKKIRLNGEEGEIAYIIYKQ